MFFLLRVAFWLSVVLVLLPTFAGGERAQQSAQPEVSASEAVSAATATVADLANFCDRQPGACTVGAQAAAVFGEKAQAGAKILYDYLSDRANPKTTGSVTANARADKGALRHKTVEAGRDTLVPSDRAPAWRKPAAKEAAAGRAG